jgi:hypothetical protein
MYTKRSWPVSKQHSVISLEALRIAINNVTGVTAELSRLSTDVHTLPLNCGTRELYLPSDRHLSMKLVPTFADRRVSRRQRGE